VPPFRCIHFHTLTFFLATDIEHCTLLKQNWHLEEFFSIIVWLVLLVYLHEEWKRGSEEWWMQKEIMNQGINLDSLVASSEVLP